MGLAKGTASQPVDGLQWGKASDELQVTELAIPSRNEETFIQRQGQTLHRCCPATVVVRNDLFITVSEIYMNR